MSELSFKGLSFSFGGPPLLDRVDLEVERGERVGLVGRNGAGKSTLLALAAGELELEGGSIDRRKGLVVARLAQEVPADLEGRVANLLTEVLGEPGPGEAWRAEERIDRTLSRLGLDGELEMAELSAGMKRRVLLARALVSEPDVLLLDEPTNHLDLEAIEGLEELLLRRAGALIFVTHDRAFLRRVATRILDLDRGALRSYTCDYATYLARREAELEAEQHQHAQFDKELAREEAWLRRGIKARRTRNQGRVRALEKLRSERGQRREQQGVVRARLRDADRSGRLVLRTEGLGYSYGGTRVLEGISIEVQRGDRVGVLGPNGCGKSTLLAVLLGELEIETGSLQHGTGLEIARFDQLHAELDESLSVQENVCGDGDRLTVGGRTRHVNGYLQDFLFTPEQIRGPVWQLSGGERNRLALARILARPCNLLVLDEPTNDLDLETLELLEQLLVDYAGTLILVSHDREFLNNTVTSTLVFEGGGHVREYVGGYDDWLRQRPLAKAEPVKGAGKSKPSRVRTQGPRRLSFAEKQELAGLPDRIEELEQEIEVLVADMSRPEFFKREGTEIAAGKARLAEQESALEQALERWELLEGIATGE